MAQKERNTNSAIYFVASARDYHGMDWYRTMRSVVTCQKMAVLTDMVDSEGVEVIVGPDDNVIELCNVDRFLMQTQSAVSNAWRNFVKAVAAPIFAYRLSKFAKAQTVAIFHAHSMYYIFICWLARIDYVATPMGSDVLVRPNQSRIYRFFTIRSLAAATSISVDSVALQMKVRDLCGKDTVLIQNGIDTGNALSYANKKKRRRSRLVSFRGMASNYNILDLLMSRNASEANENIDFIYPFGEQQYHEQAKKLFRPGDKDLGRVKKTEMYGLFADALLAVSIPTSDSSPRSVYEAIFCGCVVAVTDLRWIHDMPSSMQERVILVDLSDKNWLKGALTIARAKVNEKFIPCDEALRNYDEKHAMLNAAKKLYS